MSCLGNVWILITGTLIVHQCCRGTSAQQQPSPTQFGIFEIPFTLILTNGTEPITTLSPIITTIPLITTTISEPTTVSFNATKVDDWSLLIATLTPLINSTFQNTSGYIGLLVDSYPLYYSGYQITIGFSCIYNKTILNLKSLLVPDSTFVEEVSTAAFSMINWTEVFADNYTVNVNDTSTSVNETLLTVKEAFNSMAWLCSGILCSSNSTTCNRTSTGSVLYCAEKCDLFNTISHCTEHVPLSVVYLQGKCALDQMGNPYCDCGTSPGNIMNNFYDGTQCVSVTFIVAMSTSAAGLFLLLFVLTLGCGCYMMRRTSSSDVSEVSSNYDPRHYEMSTGEYSSHNGYSNMLYSSNSVRNKRSRAADPAVMAAIADSADFYRQPRSTGTEI